MDHVTHDRRRTDHVNSTDTLNRHDDHRGGRVDVDDTRLGAPGAPGTTGPDNTGARLGDVDRGTSGIDPNTGTPGTGGPR